MTRSIVRLLVNVLAAAVPALKFLRKERGAVAAPAWRGQTRAPSRPDSLAHVAAVVAEDAPSHTAIGEWVGLTSLAGMCAFFAWWYGRVLFALPLFGDAANHARIARAMARDGLWSTDSPYPPLYHLTAGLLMAVAGDDGFIALTVAGVVLTGIAVYFFAREVSGSIWVANTAALIAFVSPKMPFYSGRLYMEVPLAALVVICLTFFHRYLRTGMRRDLLLTALFTGIICLTKQQGLFVVAPVTLFLLMLAGWRVLRRRPAGASLRAFGLYVAVTGVMILPAMYWMLHSTGRVLPDTEFTIDVNRAGAALAHYEPPQQSAADLEWDGFLHKYYAESGLQSRGAQKAEQRHVWPLDVLTPEGFFSTSSPYWRHVALVGPRLPDGLTFNLNVLLVMGMFIWAAAPRSRPFVLFMALFLFINYASFVRSNDQWRYYLYLPYLLTVCIPLAVHRIAHRFGSRGPAVAGALLIAVIVAYASTYLPARTEAALDYGNRQAYAPSQGGMASVTEASDFLKANLTPEERFFAVPQTEFQYYADRVGVFDFRIYFLNPEDLARYLDDHAIRFIVIPDSAVKPDRQWSHVVTVPRSFLVKVAAMYPLAYQSTVRDVSVFRVIPASSIGPLPDLDFAEPTGRITAPADGSHVRDSITLRAVAADAHGVAQVLFYIDGVYVGGVPGARDEYAWWWDPSTVEPGPHTIWFKAVDASANYTTGYVTVEVDD